MSLVVSALLSGVLVASAGAVVVQTSSGQRIGFALRAGVTAGSLPGARVPGPPAGLRAAQASARSDGSVDYNGGPVLHSSAPYLIFWDPNGQISGASEALLRQYLGDVAHDSGGASDVYSVLRQYTDTTGFADYRQTFTSAQAILDTHAYPSPSGCNAVDPTGYPTCLSDRDLQTEISRLIGADSLPTGDGANAPVYLVITPQNVNICQDSGSICASNSFCAYHSSYLYGGSQVLYATVPFIVWAQGSTKGCQTDAYSSTYESPAGTYHGDPAYQIADNLSHELSETITDPLGTAWFNTYAGNGQEVGDICATYGPDDPLGGTSQAAYAPTLGGDATSGTLYDQVINGDAYYNQSEWSNGDVGCRLTSNPALGTPTAAFTAVALAVAGTAVSFAPAGSASPDRYSSASWSFGDGAAAFVPGAPATTSHTYASAGSYTVTLTLVDSIGNLTSVQHPITVADDPVAAFADTHAAPAVRGSSVGFDATKSSDPTPGGSVAGYSWSFGDGSTGSGVRPDHTYRSVGTYTVTLYVRSAAGLTSSTTGRIVVVAPGQIESVRAHGRTVTVSVSGPGLIGVGKLRRRLANAGSAAFRPSLTPSQQRQLSRTQKLTISVSVSFAPTYGTPQRRTVRVHLT